MSKTKTELMRVDPNDPGIRCVATRRDGSQCGSFPIRGGSVCRMHGGGTPQVKRKAQERIDAAADSAAAHLITWMNDKRVPMNIRLAAAKDLLDRAHIGTEKSIKVELRTFEAKLNNMIIDIEGDDFEEQPDIVDAEIVPEPMGAINPATGRFRDKR